RGMLTVKLYMMAGLPTERDEDLEAMVELVARIKDRMLEAGRRFGRAGKIIPATQRLRAQAEHAVPVGADLRREGIETPSEVALEKSRAHTERRSACDVGPNSARAGALLFGRPDGGARHRVNGAARRRPARGAARDRS